ncbi:DUF5330 domain-containing protein [Phyllobacterium sp. 22229]|uniref:DUF5330 domain-containing protein n=1 Tax=Phyllobacterium myrsinacearum TaxID=28101 RepID=A0A2S9JBW1_9HYPH|nr:DUF5330 domain-containing protein [Phyllobacterium myrsinacearum]PRD50268.1 hypothetical protein C5750_23450 [Phyllobacterium myrsinacearum]PWV90664.1 hypothetical protein DEV92_1067 [Phyllobacterium myrsinacearum]RZS88534.1 hypothetical protein EV217_0920 [Phyllobacterium myrsinacearum]RZU97065.1 hypothetical protein EV654_4643 [Phyllobacterium myrsinacearum]
MFFLIRFAIKFCFWMFLISLFIPVDSKDNPQGVPQPGPLEAFFAARETISDLSQFCTRNPNACETGKAALNNAGVRASEVAKVGYQYLDTQLGAKTNGADAAVAAAHDDAGAVAASATDKSDLIKAKLREMAMREILEAAIRQREQSNAVDGKTTGTIAKK